MNDSVLTPGAILYVCAPTDIKTGNVNVKVGMVLDMDESELPYRILWAEFVLPEEQAKSLLQLLIQDDSASMSDLAKVNPYQFINAYISREDDSISKSHFQLDTLPLDQLTFQPSWMEDVQAMQSAMDDLMEANDRIDHTLNRPRWTQVQGAADIEKAVEDIAAARANFVQFWNNRTPFIKDEAFQALADQKFFKHPVTLRY